MAQFPIKDGLLQGPLNGTPTSGTVDLSSVTLTGVSEPLLIFRHVTADGTHGGTATSGSWQTATVNEETVDTHNLGSLSSNQITLAAGTYRIEALCNFYAVNYVQTRLYNVTDSSVIAYGISGYNGTGHIYPLPLVARFTLGSSKTIRLEYRCSTTSATYGQGEATSWSGNEEVYKFIKITKER